MDNNKNIKRCNETNRIEDVPEGYGFEHIRNYPNRIIIYHPNGDCYIVNNKRTRDDDNDDGNDDEFYPMNNIIVID